jgi:hypothetical protein
MELELEEFEKEEEKIEEYNEEIYELLFRLLEIKDLEFNKKIWGLL